MLFWIFLFVDQLVGHHLKITYDCKNKNKINKNLWKIKMYNKLGFILIWSGTFDAKEAACLPKKKKKTCIQINYIF